LNTTPHPQSEEEPQVSRYVNYLRNDRGLAKNSVLVYAPFIRGLLVDQVTKTGSVSVDAFDPTSIRSFLLERIHGRSGEYARLLATALRSFFRFLFLRGELPTDLSASVPTVCKPRRTAVPAFLSPEQIDQVIAAIDRSTLTGRRDHAVLLLLARLGLRAGEIVLLELDDIHWRTGEIVIRGKGGMVDSLPLLADIGEALALYIRQDRNVNESRRVFLRVLSTAYRLDWSGGYRPHRSAGSCASRRPTLWSRCGSPAPSRSGHSNDPKRRVADGNLRSSQASFSEHDSDLQPGVLRSVADGCPIVAGDRGWPVRTMTETLVQYIALRRALGAKLREPAVRLSEFVTFLKSQGAEFITTELALCWAMQPKNAQRATWARRLSIVRRFALWLNAADPRNQIPPPRLIGGGRRRNPPHIYPDQEVELLMAEASRLPSRRKLRAHTYTTLIGLLATTGLRPGEVLALTRSDVDLQRGILSIRDSKFGKSRFVPSTTRLVSPLLVTRDAATN